MTHHVHSDIIRHHLKLHLLPLKLPPHPPHQTLHHLPHLRPADPPRILPLPLSGMLVLCRRGTVHKRHLEVHLRKFWLTIFTPVLVPEALRDLVVPVDGAAGYEQLFGLLRRLREGVECGRARGGEVSGRNEEFACALGRGVEQGGCFDFGETYGDELVPLTWLVPLPGGDSVVLDSDCDGEWL